MSVIFTGPAPPPRAVTGTLWFNSSDDFGGGRLYILNQRWIDAMPPRPGPRPGMTVRRLEHPRLPYPDPDATRDAARAREIIAVLDADRNNPALLAELDAIRIWMRERMVREMYDVA